MLTDAERELIESGVMPFSRIEALLHGLRAKRDDTTIHVHRLEDEGADERHIASLRGKRAAYQEVARMVEQMMLGKGMRPARWSSARARADAFKDRKYRRRAIKHFTPEQMAELADREARTLSSIINSNEHIADLDNWDNYE